MSSKLLRGPAATAAQSISWTKAPLLSREPSSPRGIPAVDHDEMLRQVQKDCEIRIQQAREAAFREAEATIQQQQAARMSSAYEAVAKSAGEIAAYRDKVRREAEQDIVRLALAIARKILQRELQVDSDALLALTKVVLQKIDARETHQVRVHPSHAGSLTRTLDQLHLPKRIEVIADSTLEAGAALFETSRGVLDASIDTQLGEIERGFAAL